MAISYVQTGTGVQNFSVDSFVTASVGTTTTGNFMVVAVEVGTLSEITNVQDNKGNSYSLADSVNDSLRIYYAPITSGGAGHTVTANLNTNLDLAHITAEEWTGLSALGELDRTQHNTGSSNTWDTGTTAATRTPNQLVWAVSQGLGAFRTITAEEAATAHHHTDTQPHIKIYT